MVQAVLGNLTRLKREKGLRSLSDAASVLTLFSLSISFSCSVLCGIIFTFLTLLLKPEPEVLRLLSGYFLKTLLY